MENLKKVVSVIAQLANAGDSIGKTKDWSKLFNVMPAVMALPGVDWKALGEEAKGDRTELVAHFKAEFDLHNDKLEEVIEKSVELAVRVADFVLLVLSARK